MLIRTMIAVSGWLSQIYIKFTKHLKLKLILSIKLNNKILLI